MHDQRRADSASLPERQGTAAVVLDILVGQHPAMLSTTELIRLYAGGTLDVREAGPMVTDGLADLLASGLIHRLGEFVFASRSALRARELFQ